MAIKINKGGVLGLLDLTPMIDVVFNLLIFFMVVSHFVKIDEERDLNVQLPSASEAMPLTQQPREFFINISQTGEFFVRTKLVTAEELGAMLMEAAVNNPGQTVIIRADKRVDWDFVATAMRLCNEAGIHNYSASLAEE